MQHKRQIVVAITGATGVVIGVRLLERLRGQAQLESHLIISPWGRRTIEYETSMRAAEVEALADQVHKPHDMWSPLASGSHLIDAMIIAPCSMRTLAAIATGVSDGLITRAADVALKEQRKLVLLPRETPLSAIHLDNMRTLAGMGAVLMPPVLSFYHRPSSVEDMVDHLVQRVCDQVGICENLVPRWAGREHG